MNSKLLMALVGLVIVLVAAAAFMGGRLYEKSPAVETEEAEAQMAEEAMPAEEEASQPATPPSQPAPARRRAAESTRPAPPAEPPPPMPATTPAEPSSGAAPEPPPPPAEPEPARVRLTEGTTIAFALNNSLSTKTNQTGDPFSGRVSRPVRVDGTVVIPEGATIRGTVGRVQRPGRVKGVAELSLRFDQLEMPDGGLYDLSASLSELDEGRKEQVTEEGQVKGETSKKRDAITIGAGAGIGAAVGAIAGGGKGAGTGAAIGAGAGTAAVLLTRGKDLELRQGTELALQLDRPLSIIVK